MQIICKKIDELIPYENNPRHNDQAVDAVAESIREYGFKVPIIIDKDNIIVAGHTRVKAAKRLGMTEVPCIVADDLSDEQVRAFRIADNKTTEIAEWDHDLLRDELAALENMFTGFDSQEIDDLLAEALEPLEDDYEVELPTEPRAKLGDIYQLGEHRLMCGDSTKVEDVATLMNKQTAAIAFTSPPYNAGKTPTEVKTGKESKYISDSDNKSPEEYYKLLAQSLRIQLLYCEYVFINLQQLAGNKQAITKLIYENKDSLADVMIWDKQHTQPAMAENVLNSRFEFIYIFSKAGNRKIGTKKFRGNKDNVIDLPQQRENTHAAIHSATFPVELAAEIIDFAKPKENVVDLFGGSGTTLIACEQLNRKCYMMELDPAYIDVIIDRWETYTGQEAVKL